MRILYLSYDGMTDPLGQSQVIPYLMGLTQEGHTYHLVSCDKPQRFAEKESDIRQLLQPYPITWHSIPYTKKPPILSTVKDVRAMKKLAIRLHKEHQFEVVHCRSYLSALVGIYLKKRFGVKFVFDMRGLWADERVDGGLWKLSNPLFKKVYQYFKKKERQFLQLADYTISLTQNAKQEIHRWQGMETIPIKVIPCCADLDHFSPSQIEEEKKQALQQKLNIKAQETIIGYLGSLGTWYMLDEMLAWFKIFLQAQPKAKFLIVTPDEPQMVYEKATLQGIDKNTLIICEARRAEVPYYLSLMQASLFFIKPTYSKKAASPTKQGELMGMNIPIVCNSGVGDVDTIVQDTKSGVLVAEFNENAYQKSVQELLTMLQSPQNHIRAGAEQYYSLKEGVKRYQEVYTQL